jgi:hypothetical protein
LDRFLGYLRPYIICQGVYSVFYMFWVDNMLKFEFYDKKQKTKTEFFSNSWLLETRLVDDDVLFTLLLFFNYRENDTSSLLILF